MEYDFPAQQSGHVTSEAADKLHLSSQPQLPEEHNLLRERGSQDDVSTFPLHGESDLWTRGSDTGAHTRMALGDKNKEHSFNST